MEHDGRSRLVAIGDLNAAFEALVVLLRGLRLVDRDLRWTGGDTQLVQLGDIFNRGDGARRALELLMGLQSEAAAVGGAVDVLLGNHEVMTALGNETYCTSGEYLAFATKTERELWPERVRRTYIRFMTDYPRSGPMLPVQPRLEAWAVDHVPGRTAMRRALGPTGRLGRVIRKLPVVVRRGNLILTHAGITPKWARLGVDGINASAARAWAQEPRFWGDLPVQSILRAPNGPLLTRRLAMERGPEVEAMIGHVLKLLGGRRMIVGHTRTSRIPGGTEGRIAVRFRQRFIGLDVGMRERHGAPLVALVVKDGIGTEWSPTGTRVLWRDE